MSTDAQILIAFNSLLVVLNTYMYLRMEKLADKLSDRVFELEERLYNKEKNK